MRTCLFNRSVILAIAGASFLGTRAAAQVAAGDLVVLTSGAGQTVWSMPAGGGAPTPITGMDSAVVDAATKRRHQ